jgi:hypothetical protein
MRLPLPNLLLALLAAACGSTSQDGQLRWTWEGTDHSGQLVAKATASLCPGTRLLELIASRGDSGVAVLLLPTDTTITPGRYPVFSTAIGVEPRPGAMLALRWFSVVEVEGFESLDGEVVIDEAGPSGLSGRFSARLLGVVKLDTMAVEGQFTRVVPVTRGPDCVQTSRRNLTG